MTEKALWFRRNCEQYVAEWSADERLWIAEAAPYPWNL